MAAALQLGFGVTRGACLVRSRAELSSSECLAVGIASKKLYLEVAIARAKMAAPKLRRTPHGSNIVSIRQVLADSPFAGEGYRKNRTVRAW